MKHYQLLRIIHLEDNPFDAELFLSEVEETQVPFRIDRVCSKEDFVAKLEPDCAEVIVSDSAVPGFGPWEALRQAREVCPDIPFIYLSGHCPTQLKEEALARGATDYFSKNDTTSLIHKMQTIANEKIVRPTMGYPVIVQSGEIRCLGYFDRDSVWRDYRNSDPLPKVIYWEEV